MIDLAEREGFEIDASARRISNLLISPGFHAPAIPAEPRIRHQICHRVRLHFPQAVLDLSSTFRLPALRSWPAPPLHEDQISIPAGTTEGMEYSVGVTLPHNLPALEFARTYKPLRRPMDLMSAGF